eukprot:m.161812 g.161812  ORF g.161812 m.161812 type:complete len:517 (-) comp17655_c1_seq1:51-1601(-)
MAYRAASRESAHYKDHLPQLKLLTVLPEDRIGPADREEGSVEGRRVTLHPRTTAIIDAPRSGFWSHLRWKRWQLMAVTFFLPPVLAFFLFGVIPLGAPNDSRNEKLVWIFVTNAFTFLAFNICIISIWLACLDETKPWRSKSVYITVALLSYAMQSGIMFGIFTAQDSTFELFGVIPYGINVCAVIIMTLGLRPFVWTCGCSFYRDRLVQFAKVMVVMFVYVILLSGWVMLYREIDARENVAGGVALPFMLLLVVFILKKVLLAVTDDFPIEIAMLISGLWLENLDDVFQVLVFPTAADLKPSATFAAIWLRKFAENIAYIAFLTDHWFRFRVWIKVFLKSKFTGKTPQEGATDIIDDDELDDRGHSNNKPGYLRRQAQFLMYKILSQCSANIYFIIVAPILRFGQNDDFYPLSKKVSASQNDLNTLEDDDFRNAIGFAVISFFTSLLTGVIAYKFIHYKRPEVFDQLRQLYGSLFASPVYYGFVFAIFVSSQMMGTAVLQYQYRIWFWQDSDPPK